MSPEPSEPTIGQRVGEPPALKSAQLKQVRAKDLLVRFLAGTLTSVVAGALTLLAGARVGGIMLAFPAILAASLTLIEERDDAAEAREDARGAVLGGCALTGFATVVALTLGSIGAVVALGLGTAAWALIALGGYRLLWWRRSS